MEEYLKSIKINFSCKSYYNTIEKINSKLDINILLNYINILDNLIFIGNNKSSYIQDLKTYIENTIIKKVSTDNKIYYKYELYDESDNKYDSDYNLIDESVFCSYCNESYEYYDCYKCEDCKRIVCEDCQYNEEFLIYDDIDIDRYYTRTYKYCIDCIPKWIYEQIENEKNEELKEQELLETRPKRIQELIKELNLKGLDLRSDSKYCYNYIDNGEGDIEDIVERMCQMKYLYDYCEMRNELDNVEDEHIETIEAGYYPDCSVFDEAEDNILRRIGEYPEYPNKYPWYMKYKMIKKYNLKKYKEDLHEELIKNLYHPKRIEKYLETNDNIDNYLN